MFPLLSRFIGDQPFEPSSNNYDECYYSLIARIATSCFASIHELPGRLMIVHPPASVTKSKDQYLHLDYIFTRNIQSYL